MFEKLSRVVRGLFPSFSIFCVRLHVVPQFPIFPKRKSALWLYFNRQRVYRSTDIQRPLPLRCRRRCPPPRRIKRNPIVVALANGELRRLLLSAGDFFFFVVASHQPSLLFLLSRVYALKKPILCSHQNRVPFHPQSLLLAEQNVPCFLRRLNRPSRTPRAELSQRKTYVSLEHRLFVVRVSFPSVRPHEPIERRRQRRKKSSTRIFFSFSSFSSSQEKAFFFFLFFVLIRNCFPAPNHPFFPVHPVRVSLPDDRPQKRLFLLLPKHHRLKFTFIHTVLSFL